MGQSGKKSRKYESRAARSAGDEGSEDDMMELDVSDLEEDEDLVSEAESDISLLGAAADNVFDNLDPELYGSGSDGPAGHRAKRRKVWRKSKAKTDHSRPQDHPQGAGRSRRTGPRKALEPSEEFNAYHRDATAAFIDGDLELARELAQKAISVNPEIFTAHSLLSEVHRAMGDPERAVIALFYGAHTRPKEPQMWINVAHQILEIHADDRNAGLAGAIYCYNRVLGVDRSNFAARRRRAELNLESGKLRRAVWDYSFILKEFPYDLDVLRDLARVCLEIGESPRAIALYDEAIAYYQSLEPSGVSQFSWSEANIYSELFLPLTNPREGLAKVKGVCRWLSGRLDESFWNSYQGDDCEFDLDHDPRREEVAEFQSGLHELESYGLSLPLELRVRLGVLRARYGVEGLEEAERHFEWLNTRGPADEERIRNYSDLFKEAGTALYEAQHYSGALKYLLPLKEVPESHKASTLRMIAHCFREIEEYDNAEEFYRAAFEADTNDETIYEEIAAMFEEAELPQRAGPYLDEFLERQKQRKADRPRASAEQAQQDTDGFFDNTEPTDQLGELDAQGLFTTPRSRQPPRATPSKGDNRVTSQESLASVFFKMNRLKELIKEGNTEAREEWKLHARIVTQKFRSFKSFYTSDKILRFGGYLGKVTNVIQRSSGQELGTRDSFVARNNQRKGQGDDDDMMPVSFCEVGFGEWLDCFLQFAIYLSYEDAGNAAFDVLDAAGDSNIYYHDKDATFQINLARLVCAMIVSDYQKLCNTARYFVKEYRLASDGYKLFAVMIRLCSGGSALFSGSPTQKFLLRQVKAIDSEMIKDIGPSVGLSSKEALSSRLKDANVSLLMLYGYTLYGFRNYLQALGYFNRAHKLDRKNPMIVLSIGLAHIHHALKRQAGSRNSIIAFGKSYLKRYHTMRSALGWRERQEANFNIAREFHMLGLLNLAILYYRKCLEDENRPSSTTDKDNEVRDTYTKEAAYALQTIHASEGRHGLAQNITVERLCI